MMRLAFTLVLGAATLTLAACGNKAGSDATGTGPAATGAASAELYVCPMHPEVTSDKLIDCPKCGMKLERKAR